MAKKTNAKKSTKTKKVEKEIDINDINSMVEDMKDLALNKPEEEKKEVISEEQLSQIDDNVIEDEEIVAPDIEVVTIQHTVETVEENKQETEEKPEMTDEEIKDTLDNLDFIEEIKEKEIIEEEKPKKLKIKPKMTYEQMFGATWMGYGYTEK